MKNLTVLKHVREFNRLSKYIRAEVNMEAKRKRKFMKGLQAVMRMQLRIVRTKEFQELLDSAHISEGDEIGVPEGKRNEVQKQTTTCPDPHMRYTTKKICHNCGIRGHVSRDCPNPKILCYQCGEPGHMMMSWLN